MKTSNYITLAFFTFLFGGILVLFVAARIQHGDNPGNAWISKENKLEPFSVVVAEPGSACTLKMGDPKIVSSSAEDTCFLPRYEVRNDTLILFSYTDEKVNQHIDVYGQNIHEIQGKENSDISMQGVQDSSLLINLVNARFSYNHDPNALKGSNVKLLASNSYVNIQSANFHKFDIQLDQTKIDGWDNSIGSISGSLKNNSEINVQVLQRINLEADETSRYTIHK